MFLAMSLGVSAVAAVPAVVSGVGNSLTIASQTRSATGWLVAGYVSAGLNFGAAAFAAGLLAQGGPREELGLLIGSAVIGTVDLVLTMLGHTAEPKAVARLLPRPALLWSPSGVPVVGVSTPLVSF